MIDRQVVISDVLLSLNVIKDICLVVLEYTNPGLPKMNKAGRRYKYFLKVTLATSYSKYKAYIQCLECGRTDYNRYTWWGPCCIVISCERCTATLMYVTVYIKLLIRNELPKPIKWNGYTRVGTKRLPNS